MNKFYRLIKGVILSNFIVLSIIILYYFFYFDQHYAWDSLEIKINWMVTIFFFIFLSFILLFTIKPKVYNLIFILIIIVGIPLWIILYLFEFLKIEMSFWNWPAVREIASIICISLLAPGLSLNFIKYIKNHSNRVERGKVDKKYHIHEGFVGILFLIFALFLWNIRYYLIQNNAMKTELRIFLALDMIPLIIFLFSGSFLVFRDRRDLLRLKFIEKNKSELENRNSLIFNPITTDSIAFFKSPRIPLYPLGILLSSFSINMFIHGNLFLSNEIISLTHETIVFLGFVLCFIAAGLIGIDWFRFFGKVYPDLYQDVVQILNDFKINP